MPDRRDSPASVSNICTDLYKTTYRKLLRLSTAEQFRLQTKPRRVFRPQAKKQLNLVFSGGVYVGETLLSPEVCELSSSQAPYQLASVQKHESSFTSLLVLSISKQIALKLIRKTEGTKMQLSPCLAEAEWSEFRLTQCAHRAASPPSAKSLGLCRRLETAPLIDSGAVLSIVYHLHGFGQHKGRVRP